MHPVEVMEEAKPQPKAVTPAPAGPSNDPPKTEKKKTVLKATTCDLCTQLDMPSCVYACPHDAARRVDPIEYFTALSREANIQINPYKWNLRKTFDTRTTHKQDTDLIDKS